MKKGKLLALVFSDLHYHDWNKYNEGGRRTSVAFEIISRLQKKALINSVPLLFTGDFFHRQSGLSTNLLDNLTLNINRVNHLTIYGISGNHDQSEINNKESKSPSLYQILCRMYPMKFTCLDYDHMDFKLGKIHIRVHGIPYITFNNGFSEALEQRRLAILDKNKANYNILLIHTNLHGSTETDGRLMVSPDVIPENMDQYFKDFDWVLCGHIHRPQRLGKSIIQVGSPNQQKVSDINGKFGYWEIYERDAVFIEFTNLPKFKIYQKSNGPGNDFDYWVPDDEKMEPVQKNGDEEFLSFGNRSELAKKYCKTKGIKSKLKIETLTDLLND